MKYLEVLLIDDDELHLEIMLRKLNSLSITNVKCINNYKDACILLETYMPDLVILDYYLDKGHTGVDLIKEHLLNQNVPVIFVSTFYGKDVFDEILDVVPVDFIPKNVSDFELEKVIRLATAKKKEKSANEKLKDFIFVRYGREIKKINVMEIEYISVDGKYLTLHVSGKKYLIRSTLNDFIKKLPSSFIKIHQAYIINLRYMESIQVDEGLVKIGGVTVPFSRNHKKDLFNAYYLP
jgi:DNA-binding LytR/AlgR family response regulator